MFNFCVDEVDTDGRVRQRQWFETRDKAILAAETRQLVAPVEPSSCLHARSLDLFRVVGPVTAATAPSLPAAADATG